MWGFSASPLPAEPSQNDPRLNFPAPSAAVRPDQTTPDAWRGSASPVNARAERLLPCQSESCRCCCVPGSPRLPLPLVWSGSWAPGLGPPRALNWHNHPGVPFHLAKVNFPREASAPPVGRFYQRGCWSRSCWWQWDFAWGLCLTVCFFPGRSHGALDWSEADLDRPGASPWCVPEVPGLQRGSHICSAASLLGRQVGPERGFSVWSTGEELPARGDLYKGDGASGMCLRCGPCSARSGTPPSPVPGKRKGGNKAGGCLPHQPLGTDKM